MPNSLECEGNAGKRPEGPRPAFLVKKGNNCDNNESPAAARSVSSYEIKRMYAIEKNIEAFIEQHELERVGFFSVTFPRCVLTWQQAQARFHSFSRRVLKTVFVDYICVLEFHRDGRPHYHLLVATKDDIRGGFDFAVYEALQQDSRKPVNQRMPLKVRRALSRRLTTNESLKAIWKRIRESAEAYGVGRCETVPIRKTAQAVGRYVSGYITESLANRRAEHKGARFVRYSRSFRRPVKSGFSWAGERGWVWRSKVRQWAIRRGCYSLSDVRRLLGRSWCHRYREQIRATSLSWYPTGRHARADGQWFPVGAIDCRLVRRTPPLFPSI